MTARARTLSQAEKATLFPKRRAAPHATKRVPEHRDELPNEDENGRGEAEQDQSDDPVMPVPFLEPGAVETHILPCLTFCGGRRNDGEGPFRQI